MSDGQAYINVGNLRVPFKCSKVSPRNEQTEEPSVYEAYHKGKRHEGTQESVVRFVKSFYTDITRVVTGRR